MPVLSEAIANLRPLTWRDGPDGGLELLDQTRLPTETVRFVCRGTDTLIEAIQSLRVRGAPAIGCAAAYGVVLAFDEVIACAGANWPPALQQAAERIADARPTAVNLRWAVQRMLAAVETVRHQSPGQVRAALLAEAHAIRDEDAAMCRQIGAHGASLIADGAGVLTHCNAGALATSEFGTALAPIYTAALAGRRVTVFVDETRPLLQGSRLTAWELTQAGIDAVLICDNMAAKVMRERRVDLVITGADRIAANGDTANKIGTYGVAVLARAHGIPFYVAAPSSTFDRAIPTGEAIPIEERDPREIRAGFGRLTAPPDVRCYCPAFDVTPAELIAGIITERGIIRPPYEPGIRAALDRG